MPAAAVPAPTVSVALPPAVTEVGLSDAVAPEGVPVTDSETVCALPLVTAVEMVEVPEAPCCTLSEAGFALMEKSFAGGGPLTTSVTEVVCVADAPVPVTVIV